MGGGKPITGKTLSPQGGGSLPGGGCPAPQEPRPAPGAALTPTAPAGEGWPGGGWPLTSERPNKRLVA